VGGLSVQPDYVRIDTSRQNALWTCGTLRRDLSPRHEGRARAWAHHETGNRPGFREGHVAAYSRKTNRMVIFGRTGGVPGRSVVELDDVWVLDRANGEPSFVPERLTINKPDYPRICAGNKHTFFAVAEGPGGTKETQFVRPSVSSSRGI
jgi:hypothetical protein